MRSLLYFVARVRCRRKESSRSLSHLLMSFLSLFFSRFSRLTFLKSFFECFYIFFMVSCAQRWILWPGIRCPTSYQLSDAAPRCETWPCWRSVASGVHRSTVWNRPHHQWRRHCSTEDRSSRSKHNASTTLSSWVVEQNSPLVEASCLSMQAGKWLRAGRHRYLIRADATHLNHNKTEVMWLGSR